MPDQNPTDPQNPVVPTVTDTPPMSPPAEPTDMPPMDGSEESPPPPIVVQEEEQAGSAAPPSSLPEEMPKKKFGRGRLVATILGILILVGGLGAGLVLVQQQAIFKQRASTGEPCKECSGGKCKTVASPPSCQSQYNTCSKDPQCAPTSTPTPTATRPPTPPTGTPTASGTPTFPPPNACTTAGGKCVSAPNCLNYGGAINGGSGCGNASQVCCARNTTVTPTPTVSLCPRDCITPKSKCAAGSFYPNESQSLGWGDCGAALGEYCCNSATGTPTVTVTVTVTPPPPSYCSTPTQGCKCSGNCTWTKACGIWFCDCHGDLSCDGTGTGGGDPCRDASGNSVSCSSLGRSRCNCGNGVWVGISGNNCTAACVCIGCPTCTTPPPEDVTTCRCLAVRAWDTNWTELKGDQLTALKAGDRVRLTVSATFNKGSVDKAKFKVNGQETGEITTLKPGETAMYYYEYVIPEGVTAFTVSAKIYHSTLGWSN